MTPKADTPHRCTEPCWTPVPCPTCRRPLPPRGRSLDRLTILDQCCQQARADIAGNPRHLWSSSDAERQYPDLKTRSQEEYDACMAVQTRQRETHTVNTLQSELLDLIKLMPDSQVDEILAFIATLREARALARTETP